MKEILLNELPQYSPWPARLSRLAGGFVGEPRTIEKILREYDTDKYGPLLKWVVKRARTVDEVKWKEIGISRDAEVCFSRGGKLFVDTAEAVMSLRDRLFVECLRPYMEHCDAVVELGAGWGYNLSLLQRQYPHKLYLGGEVTPNGRAIAKAVLPAIPVEPFNFYDNEWPLFKSAPSRALVLTCHSTEMLPDAEIFLARLERYKRQIVSVVQFEPVYGLGGDTPLGVVRDRYIKANNYNTNFHTVLTRRAGIEVARMQYDFFGANPLFPESLIEWRFT